MIGQQDPLFPDLLFVAKGKLKVTLELKQPESVKLSQERPLATKELLIAKSHSFDHFVLSEDEHSVFKIRSIEAVVATRVVLLPYRHYKDFANDASRSIDAINSLFLTQIPNLRQISHNRRHKLISSFKELVSQNPIRGFLVQIIEQIGSFVD